MTSPSRPINLHQLTIALLILLGVLVHRNQCAPAVEDEDVEGGCYYMFNHYGEGDRILTNEPCLNCTCHNSMLMCYLRVCPFTKPIGQDCTIEKKPDQCCPVITCPQVPVSLVTPTALLTTTSTTTVATVPSSEIAILERGCEMDGKYYPDGAQVASDVNKPCELCYCIRNRTACVMQECILHVEGCSPIFESGVCCPVRYQCDGPLEIETTTNGFGNMISTTISNIFGVVSSTPQPGGCVRDGEYYADGSQIPSPEEDPCNHCYCMRGDIVCAVQECGSPLENEGGNCTAVKPRAGLCCPEKYACHVQKKKGKNLIHTNETNDSPMDDEPIMQTTEHAAVVTLPKLTGSEQTTLASLVSSKAPPQPLESVSSTFGPTSTPEEDETQATTVSVQSDDASDKSSTSSNLISQSSTSSPDSLSSTVAAEATTVHVKVITTDGETVDQTTVTPVNSDEGSTGQSDAPSSIPTSSLVTSTTEQQADTTGRPADDNTVSEKDTTLSPVVSSVEPEVKEPISTSTTPKGTAAEMILTTTPESETSDDAHDDNTDEGNQPTTIPSSSVVEQSTQSSVASEATSTAAPSSINDIIASTTVGIKDDGEMDDAATTLNPEIKVPEHSSSSPVTHDVSSTTEQSTEVPLGDDKAPGEETLIHMTTQQPDDVKETEIPKQGEGVTTPKVESVASSTTSAPTQENTEPSTDVPATTVVENLVSSSQPSSEVVSTEKSISTTEKQEPSQNDEGATTVQPEISSSTVESVSSLASESTSEVGLTTVATKVVDGETTQAQSDDGQEPTNDETDEPTTTIRQPIVPVKVESVSSTTENDVGTLSPDDGVTTIQPSQQSEVQSSTQGSTSESSPDLHDLPDTTQGPSVDESQTQSSVSTGASEVAASSVATERVVTTTIPSGSEEPDATTTPSSVSHSSAGVSEEYSSSTEHKVIVEASTVSPQEGQTTLGNIQAEEKYQTVNNSKPIFIVATTEGHTVIIPEQNDNSEAIPVMPLQRENVTTGIAHEPSSTSHPSSSSVPDDDDDLNNIHDEVPHETTHEEKLSTVVSSTTEKIVPTTVPSSEKPTERVPEVVDTEPDTTVSSVSQQSEGSTVIPLESSTSSVDKVSSVSESVGTTAVPTEQSVGVTSESPVSDEPVVGSSEGTTLKPDEVPEVPTTIPPLEPANVPEVPVVSSTETIEATTVERESPDATTVPVQVSTTSSPSSTTEKPLADEIENSASTTAEDVTSPSSSTEGTTSKSVEVSSESQSTSDNSIEGGSTTASSSASVDSEDVSSSSSSSSTEPEELGSTTVRHTVVDGSSDDVQETSTSSGEEKDTSSTTTEAEDTSIESTPGAVRVPGEGSCFVEGITYQNGSRIPPSTSFQLACACQNSIVHCLLVHCPPAPTDLGDCKPVYKRGICCPTYDCGDASSSSPSITVTPEPEDKIVTPSGGLVTVTAQSLGTSTVESASDKIDVNAPSEDGQTTVPTVVEESPSQGPDVAPSHSQVTESSSSSTTESPVAGPVDESHSEEPLSDVHSDKPEVAQSPDVVVTVEPGVSKSPESSNLQNQGVTGGILGTQTTDEILGTTPESVASSSPVQSTNVHTQTEISMVSSSSSSSVSSVASSSSTMANSTSSESQSVATSPEQSSTSSSIVPVTDAQADDIIDHSVSTSSSTSSPIEVSTSFVPSTVENEVFPVDVGNDSSIESTAGSKYPVTTTTSVTPSPAPWPYPSSSTAAPAMSSGACLFDGRVYMSAQQIPRDDPCDFCFCFRGDIICLQQSCPPPIPGCYEEPIPGFCCPRYECPVGSGNTTTSTPLFPPSYYHSQILNNAAQPSSNNGGVASPPPNNIATGPGCEIQGEYYETGQVILSTSGPCLECRCGSQGMMECDPRECQPEPMLRKMIAAITSR